MHTAAIVILINGSIYLRPLLDIPMIRHPLRVENGKVVIPDGCNAPASDKRNRFKIFCYEEDRRE